jgi:amidohydrolase
MTVPTPGDLAALVRAGTDRMVDVRRDLHRHPELGFAETRTTARIAEVANGLGLGPLPCPTDTGSVWSLAGGRPGATVLLRADIDALPIDETTDVGFASEVDGCMHACGHDAHVAQLLGAAAALSRRAEDLPGRYVFLFQPAEEIVGGATAMLEGGVLDGLDPVAVVGCHVASVIPTGLVGVRRGIVMSDARSLRIDVHGIGGHGAAYTDGADPLAAAARLALRLGDLVEGLELEGTPCACSAGMLRAGTAPNVIPSHATVSGTLRTFTSAHTATALARLDDLVAELASTTGCTFDVTEQGHTPAVVNDPGVTAVVRDAAVGVLGADAVVDLPPVAPSDDVSEFLARIPGSYFFVGARRADGTSGMHHNPGFAIDEACMPVGAAVLAAAAVAAATGPAGD